ncbi:MAG: hypothetical protein LBE48_03675 [Methanomassiliicoccaceae archaeon]|jgi:hypothetical protein|nr:hypothetical protein [Methanomassiliicoccaceae archaeon]
MSETRVDPTVTGLFLVGFITLFFGLLGIDLFQDAANNGLVDVAGNFIGVIGIIMVVLAYMAGKSGNAFATALFAFVAVALFGVRYGIGETVAFPVVFYAIAFFFVIFAIVAFLVGAPKLVVILLFLVALLYFFVGLWFGYEESSYAAAFGVFGILSFLVATYSAVGLGTQKLPVF